VTAFVSAGAGFLIAVLWFDLMFDVQVRGHPGQLLPEVALVMLATLAAIVVEIADGRAPIWVGWASLALAGSAILLAALRTVPNAVRLGGRDGTADQQSTLARSILHEHLLCLGAITALLVLQLAST
jgi:hypothetical protein